MRSNLHTWVGAVAIAALLSGGTIAACDSSSGVHENPPVADSAPPGTDSSSSGGTDGAPTNDSQPPLDCFPNPTTHDEIINACTDAAKFDKKPNLPLLLPDGGLPPLP